VGKSHSAVEFVNQGAMLGTGHAVLQCQKALENFEGEILVTCGDAPLLTGATLADLLEKRRENDAAASMLVGRLENAGSYGRVVMDGSDVEKIVEAKDASSEELALPTVNAGTYCFKSADLWAQLSKVGNDNKSGEYYLTDVIGLLRAAGETVVGVHVSEREMTGINTKAELAALESQLQSEEIALAQSEATPS
jgi:bifunctional UDP-N-acetylglucosamine pyrophosphorylase / glucosamine-1-phosphate N-acetyltransferase